MYIDTLTFFILAEVTVVYVIITAFLFHKQRLYHVLIALLKEMRWSRFQSQQQQQQELAVLRAQNQKLLNEVSKAQAMAKNSGQSIAEQLENHLHSLEEADEEPQLEHSDISAEEANQLSWLRQQILMLEQRLLAEHITEPQWQAQLSELLSHSAFNPASTDAVAKPDADNDDLSSRLESAYDRIALMETELMAYRAINVQEEPQIDRPEKGMYADEIYTLKCEKFDIQEALNKARLMLQQMNPDEADFNQQQDEHIEQLDQYIKRADMSLTLMEKELEASNHENEALETQVKELKNRLKDLSVASDKGNTIKQKNMNQLANNASKKVAALANLRDSIEQMRHGSDPEAAMALQEGEISRLELLVRDSENCISVLEMELEKAFQQIEQLTEDTQRPAEPLIDNALSDRLGELNDQQQNSIDSLKGHLEAIRGGGDAMEIIIEQEEDINNLQRMLKETQTLVTQLQSQLPDTDSSAETKPPFERPDSNENMEEMESLVKEFITDMQGMMGKIKELEAENKQLSKVG